MSKGNKMGRFL